MKITIVYDNGLYQEGFKEDWGFGCVIDAYGKRLLFDTGAKGDILLENMRKLNIDPKSIEEVFISHDHWDHVGGLADFLELNNNVRIYAPFTMSGINNAREVLYIEGLGQLDGNFYTTGVLQNSEQSLVIKDKKGCVVLVGCSHPGVENILTAAEQIAKPWAIIGGFHGLSSFHALKSLEIICATHCTEFKAEIKALYPKQFEKGGVGKVLELNG